MDFLTKLNFDSCISGSSNCTIAYLLYCKPSLHQYVLESIALQSVQDDDNQTSDLRSHHTQDCSEFPAGYYPCQRALVVYKLCSLLWDRITMCRRLWCQLNQNLYLGSLVVCRPQRHRHHPILKSTPSPTRHSNISPVCPTGEILRHFEAEYHQSYTQDSVLLLQGIIASNEQLIMLKELFFYHWWDTLFLLHLLHSCPSMHH